MKILKLNQQECAELVSANSAKYEDDVILIAREYLDDLRACGKQSLALPSPEVDRAWKSGQKFWNRFSATL